MKKFAAAIGATLVVVAVPSYADNTALILKTGSFSLADDTQSSAGLPLTFDENASGIFGAELEWRMASGAAFGVELLRYNNDWRSGIGTSGDLDTTAFMFNGKKYFVNDRDPIRPYIGAGIGFASVDFHGPGGSASGDDLALQAMAGIDFRFNQVGLYTEVKYLSSRPEDDFGDDIDVSGIGVFGGVSVNF